MYLNLSPGIDYRLSGPDPDPGSGVGETGFIREKLRIGIRDEFAKLGGIEHTSHHTLASIISLASPLRLASASVSAVDGRL